MKWRLLGRATLARWCCAGLNNAEYTFTVRDLTGVESLDPVKEFPADSASGEGFMNVGNSLVMSPLWSPSISTPPRKSPNTRCFCRMASLSRPAYLRAIGRTKSSRPSAASMRRFTENGAGSAVNLQGIKFDTKDGGVLPLEKYLAATLERSRCHQERKKSITERGEGTGLERQVSRHALWKALNDRSSIALAGSSARAVARRRSPVNPTPLLETIRQWQQALWRFTTVGHIGKRDGPKAWQVPVTPLAAAREVRLKIPAPTTAMT